MGFAKYRGSLKPQLQQWILISACYGASPADIISYRSGPNEQ
jgi:hypothetical protein